MSLVYKAHEQQIDGFWIWDCKENEFDSCDFSNAQKPIAIGVNTD